MTDQTNIDDQLLNQGLEDDDQGGAAPAKVETDKPADTEVLELGSEEAPELTDEQKAEEQRKTRSKRWESRVDNLTARLRDAERRAAEAEAKGPGKTADAPELKAPDPNDGKYEFGEADPQYIRDSVMFEVNKAQADKDAAAEKAGSENAVRAEVVTKLEDGMANVQKAGAERYDDFEAKIAEAVEARGGEPLHPMVGIGIAVSPAGADVAYRLATDEAVSEKIEKLAKTNPHAAAIAFGELEGEYLEDDSDGDLNPSDPLDLARMLGRERARRKNGGAAKKVDPATRITKAPKPSENRARGASGSFEVSDDTDDFAAFEKKHMKVAK